MHKKLFSLLPILLLWAALSVLIWSWIFSLLTDTSPDKKVVLFVDLAHVEDRALAVTLEEALPAELRMVQVHPFSYAMLDSEQLLSADLYIIRESSLKAYQEWLAPLPDALRHGELWPDADEPVAVKIADNGTGSAGMYVSYTQPDGTQEACYLCFGKQSLHVAGNEGATDAAALAVAEKLLTLP